jgi:hypothetical protein
MFLVVLALVLVLCVIPVKIGASVVGATRDGLLPCFVALVLASLVGGLAARYVHLGGAAVHRFHLGGVLSVFVAALVYMLVLGTTYLRGLAVAVIQFALTVLLVMALAGTFVGPTLHRALQ